jgi:hypothetical protein
LVAQPFNLDRTQRIYGVVMGCFLTRVEKMHIGLPPRLQSMEVVHVRAASDRELGRLLLHSSVAFEQPVAADTPACSPERAYDNPILPRPEPALDETGREFSPDASTAEISPRRRANASTSTAMDRLLPLGLPPGAGLHGRSPIVSPRATLTPTVAHDASAGSFVHQVLNASSSTSATGLNLPFRSPPPPPMSAIRMGSLNTSY